MATDRYQYLEEQQHKQQALRNGGIEEYGYSQQYIQKATKMQSRIK